MHLETDATFDMPVLNGWVKSVYKGFVIGSSSFTPAAAEAAIRDGVYDAIGFGRLFISNPDLVERIRKGQDLNVFDTRTFYIRDQVKGYIDYPRFDQSGGVKKISPEAIGKSKL
jgi:N-ethylmaleimide reductase